MPRLAKAISARPLRIAAFLQLEVEYGRGILRGVAQCCRQWPDAVVLRFNKPAKFDRAVLLRLRVDGIIAKIGNLEEERLLAGLGVPVVNVSGQIAEPRLPTVNTDDHRVGRLAMQHLFSRGFRQVAYVGSERHSGSQRRWEGFSEAARELRVTLLASRFMPRVELDRPYRDAQRTGLAAWLGELAKPVGIFTFTDQVALEIDEACERAGLRVPDEIAILGTGNDQTRLGFARMELSSIQLNSPRIGFVAAETLLALIQGGRVETREVLIGPVKIVARHSTDRAAVNDEIVSHALDHIRENAGNVLYVEEVARTVGVSRRMLELRFRRALHVSVYAEIQRVHFERALELMPDPSLTLGEIAEAAGFPSAQHFSTAFRKRYGQSARDYRARVL